MRVRRHAHRRRRHRASDEPELLAGDVGGGFGEQDARRPAEQTTNRGIILAADRAPSTPREDLESAVQRAAGRRRAPSETEIPVTCTRPTHLSAPGNFYARMGAAHPTTATSLPIGMHACTGTGWLPWIPRPVIGSGARTLIINAGIP